VRLFSRVVIFFQSAFRLNMLDIFNKNNKFGESIRHEAKESSHLSSAYEVAAANGGKHQIGPQAAETDINSGS
jgi:hypothetical protein